MKMTLHNFLALVARSDIFLFFPVMHLQKLVTNVSLPLWPLICPVPVSITFSKPYFLIAYPSSFKYLFLILSKLSFFCFHFR